MVRQADLEKITRANADLIRKIKVLKNRNIKLTEEKEMLQSALAISEKERRQLEKEVNTLKEDLKGHRSRSPPRKKPRKSKV